MAVRAGSDGCDAGQRSGASREKMSRARILIYPGSTSMGEKIERKAVRGDRTVVKGRRLIVAEGSTQRGDAVVVCKSGLVLLQDPSGVSESTS